MIFDFLLEYILEGTLVSSSLIKSGKPTDSSQVISRSQERYRPSAYITLNLKQEAHPYSS